MTWTKGESLFDMMLRSAPDFDGPGIYLKASDNFLSDENGAEAEVIIIDPNGTIRMVHPDGENYVVEPTDGHAAADIARYDAAWLHRLDHNDFNTAAARGKAARRTSET